MVKTENARVFTVNPVRTSSATLALALPVALLILAAFAMPNELETEFERRYEAWKTDCTSPPAWFSSRLQDQLTTNYLAIVEMGMKVLPLITEKCESDADFGWNYFAWRSITRYSPVPRDNPWCRESPAVWWAGGQALGNERSESIVAKIKTAREVGDKSAEAQHWKTLECLGVFALDTLFKELKNGDSAAVAPIKDILYQEMKQGKLDKDADAAGLLVWWEKNKSDFKLPPGEITPAMRLPPPPFW